MNNLDKLTPRERDVYDYILEAIRRDGFAPSVRDICTALDMKSTSTVHTYLNRLEEKGVIISRQHRYLLVGRRPQ